MQLAAEADVAQKALFHVSDSILRWRDQLVVTSLERETYGQEPTAQQVLSVVADMDHEVQVSVLDEASLPADLKAKLVAKREELAAKQLEAQRRREEIMGSAAAAAAAAVAAAASSSGATAPAFQHRHILDAPEKLARLVAAAAAARSAGGAPAGLLDKENIGASAGPTAPASGTSSFPTGRPLANVMPNSVRLVQNGAIAGKLPAGGKRRSPSATRKRMPAAAAPAEDTDAAAPYCEPPVSPERVAPPRLTLVELVAEDCDEAMILAPGCDLTLPGELPGAGPDAGVVEDGGAMSLVPFLPSLKIGRARHAAPKRHGLGRHSSLDRRTALTAAVAAFDAEEVLVPRLALR